MSELSLQPPPGSGWLLASADIPPVISLSNIDEPELVISLKLLEVDHPITFALCHTAFHPLTNCLVVRNTNNAYPEYVPTVHINRDVRSPLTLSRERAAEFVTIRPGEEHVFSINLRPFGIENASGNASPEAMPGLMALKKKVTFGMHNWETGQTYEVGVRAGLKIPLWLPSTKSELLVACEERPLVWQPRGPPIDISSSTPVQFRVEA